MQNRQAGETALLNSLKTIIHNYRRLVLINASGYTLNKRKAGLFTQYIFITAFTLYYKCHGEVPLGDLIDMMSSVVGPDFYDEQLPYSPDELLIIDPNLHTLIKAINTLDSLSKEVYVLHYIEKLSIKELSGILNKPSGQIELVLKNAKDKIADYFVRNQSLKTKVFMIPAWLDELARALIVDDRDDLTDMILRYVFNCSCLPGLFCFWAFPDRLSLN